MCVLNESMTRYYICNGVYKMIADYIYLVDLFVIQYPEKNLKTDQLHDAD